MARKPEDIEKDQNESERKEKLRALVIVVAKQKVAQMAEGSSGAPSRPPEAGILAERIIKGADTRRGRPRWHRWSLIGNKRRGGWCMTRL